MTRQQPAGQPAGGWHPDQRLSLEEALRAFTAGPAYASFDEGRAGILKVGRRADLTVVDRDLFGIPPEELLKVAVRMTIIKGQPAYEAGGR